MGMLGTATLSAAAVATAGAIVIAEAAGGPDIWTMLEKGGAPMAGMLLLALVEVGRRYERLLKIIEAKDATILELAKRQASAMETSNGIANDQMTTARNTERLLRELVTLRRGKLDIG